MLCSSVYCRRVVLVTPSGFLVRPAHSFGSPFPSRGGAAPYTNWKNRNRLHCVPTPHHPQRQVQNKTKIAQRTDSTQGTIAGTTKVSPTGQESGIHQESPQPTSPPGHPGGLGAAAGASPTGAFPPGAREDAVGVDMRRWSKARLGASGNHPEPGGAVCPGMGTQRGKGSLQGRRGKNKIEEG